MTFAPAFDLHLRTSFSVATLRVWRQVLPCCDDSKLQLTKLEQLPIRRWLIVRGRGEQPLPSTGWTLERHASSRRPTVQQGDVAVCYASVWQAVFAVVEVVSDPVRDPELERWSWRFDIQPRVAVGDLHERAGLRGGGDLAVLDLAALLHPSLARAVRGRFAADRGGLARVCSLNVSAAARSEGQPL